MTVTTYKTQMIKFSINSVILNFFLNMHVLFILQSYQVEMVLFERIVIFNLSLGNTLFDAKKTLVTIVFFYSTFFSVKSLIIN